MNRDEDIRDLFESASVRPSPEERSAILAAAEPMLAEYAAAATAEETERHAPRRAATRPSIIDRLGTWRSAFRRPARLAFTAAAAAVLGLVLFARPPETRDTRSAPLQTWTEHVTTTSGGAFPLAPATFSRPY